MIRYGIPDSLDREIEEFARVVARYESGDIDESAFKAARVPFGVYEQRIPGTYMVRIRCAAGVITPEQLVETARISLRYGGRNLHLTTRQEIQIHGVKCDRIIGIIRELRRLGLSTRGGGGNTVRNITAPVDAGVSPVEEYDVTPYAVALTSRLIAEEDSWTLPRKFKIAFSGSVDDTAGAVVHDVGFIARREKNRRGFRVYVAGGMGKKASPAHMLLDFVPDTEVYAVARAVKNIFRVYGDRENRHAARLRFLWESRGEEWFRTVFREEFNRVRREFPPLDPPVIVNGAPVREEEHITAGNDASFALWRERHTFSQKQPGLVSIRIPVSLGNLANETALALGEFLHAFGENCIRISPEQNFTVRNIPPGLLRAVYGFLRVYFPASGKSALVGQITVCAGAATCRLGICNSQGAARAIYKCLADAPWLNRLPDLNIRISGCPNSCGRHLTGDIGLQGFVARQGARTYPAYRILLGGSTSGGIGRFSEQVGEIAARNLPGFIRDFLEEVANRCRTAGSFGKYLESRGKEYALRLLTEKYHTIPDFDTDANFYSDWDAGDVFGELAE